MGGKDREVQLSVMSDYDHLIKLLMLGDTAVGKSSLLMRFCEEKYEQNHVITIGVDFKMKTIMRESKKLQLQVWDTAGQERFRTITPTYYRAAMGVVLTYDITSEDTFNNVQAWMQNLMEHTSEGPPTQCVLVGNKSDLEEQRVVSRERGEKLAEQYGIKLFETSAKTGEGVETAYFHLADRVYETRFASESGNQDKMRKVRVDLAATTRQEKCRC